MNAPAALTPTSVAPSPAAGPHAPYAAWEDMRLVHAFNAGDQAAFAEISRRYRLRLHTTAFGMLKCHADAEEIAQDALVRAYRGLIRFRGDSSLSTWLIRIALNLSKNRYGTLVRRGRHTTLSLDESRTENGRAGLSDRLACDSPGPDREIIYHEYSVIIASCIAHLAPPAQSLLTMRTVDHLSYEEIAQNLDLKTGTVKSRLARIRVQLRALLSETCPEFRADEPSAAWFGPNRQSLASAPA